MAESAEAEPSTPSPTGTFSARILPIGAMLTPTACSSRGNARHRARTAKQLDGLVIQLHTMGMPDIRPDPFEAFDVIRRILAEDFE